MCPVDDNLIDLSWTGLDIVGYVDWLSISLVVWPCGEMRVVPLEGERERGREGERLNNSRSLTIEEGEGEREEREIE